MAKDKKFLALTALEEFWDISKEILFLGEGCLRFSKRKDREGLRYSVIEKPITNEDTFIEAYNYCGELFEMALPCISESLNKLHNLDYTDKFWRIVIGPWLSHFIPVLYERYLAVQGALDKDGDITTLLLDESDYIIPKDTNSFFSLIEGDQYNLQIYSVIYSFLSEGYTRQKFSGMQRINEPDFYRFGNRFEVWLKKIINFITRLSSSSSDIICLYGSNFANNDNKFLIKMFLKSLGRVAPFYTPYFQYPDIPLNVKMRTEDLKFQFPVNDTFSGLLQETLPLFIPGFFIEGFYRLREIIGSLFNLQPEYIFSSNSFWFDEIFKVWTAHCVEHGTRLLIVQHGGNYGSSKIHISEEFERSISDIFYTWGWSKREDKSIKIMPAVKLMNTRKYKSSEANDEILFVVSELPRYFKGFYYGPNFNFAKYLDLQLQFIQNISEQIKDKLRIRLYYRSLGWDMKERILDVDKRMTIEEPGIPFYFSLYNSRLYVCDHLSTTFLEALSKNIPTILFWDPGIEALRQEAKPFYDKLHEAGILHYNPVDAAQAVNKIYPDIEGWWNEKSRVDAVKQFCYNFARREDNEVKIWLQEFKSLLKRTD